MDHLHNDSIESHKDSGSLYIDECLSMIDLEGGESACIDTVMVYQSSIPPDKDDSHHIIRSPLCTTNPPAFSSVTQG